MPQNHEFEPNDTPEGTGSSGRQAKRDRTLVYALMISAVIFIGLVLAIG